MKKKCKNCGKTFEANRTYKLYCCEKCRNEYARKNPKPKKKKIEISKTEALVKDAVEARNRGMTYGQYKAWQYQQEEKKQKERKREK